MQKEGKFNSVIKKYVKMYMLVFMFSAIFYITLVSSIDYSSNATEYIINSTNYYARCSNVTGLCSIYNYSDTLLFDKLGETQIGIWDRFDPDYISYAGIKFRGLMEEDIVKYEIANPNVTLSDEGNYIRISTTHENADVQFNTTFDFYLTDKFYINNSILYKTALNITDELFRVGVPSSVETHYLDAFEPPVVSNSVQVHSFDSLTGLFLGGDVDKNNQSITLNTDLDFVKEGTGSVKFYMNDSGDDTTDVVPLTLYPRISNTSWKYISLWIYPTEEFIYGRTRAYNSSSTYHSAGRTIRFPANKWTLFIWNVNKTDGWNGTLDTYQITLFDGSNSNFFDANNITIYYDDMRVSANISDGINGITSDHANVVISEGYYSYDVTEARLHTIDEDIFRVGAGSLKFAGVNLSLGVSTTIDQLAYTSSYPQADSSFLQDISNYDYVSLFMRKNCSIDSWDAYSTLSLEDSGSTAENTVFMPFMTDNVWYPIYVDLNNLDSDIDITDIETYNFGLDEVAAGGVDECDMWVDDYKLVKFNGEISDALWNNFSKQGQAVKFARREFRYNNMRVYGSDYGASNIEYIEFNPVELTLDMYSTLNDMRYISSTVNHSFEAANTTSYSWLYQTKNSGDITTSTLVIDINHNALNVSKERWFRNYQGAYSFGPDDFQISSGDFKDVRALFCGTSNVLSSDYCKSGILGNSLKSSTNLWYYIMNTDDIWSSNSTIKAFYELLYNTGIEIALHTPHNLADNRSRVFAALSDFNTTFGATLWVDHSGSGNPEDLQRYGMFPSLDGTSDNSLDSGYYSLDLMNASGIRYVVPIGGPRPSSSPNLFSTRKDDINNGGIGLPYKHSLYVANGGDGITIVGRTNGGGSVGQFKSYEGGGNISSLDETLDRNGYVLTYMHAQDAGIVHDDGSGEMIINSSVEEVMEYLNNKSRDGEYWVESHTIILDWMRDLENVEISDATTNNITVRNKNNKAITGVTLDFENGNISNVIVNGLYEIYVKDNNVVLSELPENSETTLLVTLGSYNSSLPRISYLGPYLYVKNSYYNFSADLINLTVYGSMGNGTLLNQNISLSYNNSNSFVVRNDNYIFATVVSGSLHSSNSSYSVSYNFSTGELNFTLPEMSQHEILLEQETDTPTISLLSPANSYSEESSSATINFQFNVTDESSIANCTLYLSSTAYQNTSAINKSIANTISVAGITPATYTWSVNCTDTLNNIGNSSTRTLTITAPAAVSTSSTGGGIAQPIEWTNTFTYDNKELIEKEPLTRDLEAKNRIRVLVGKEKHYVGVKEIINETVHIEVASTPQEAILKIGESKKFDVTDDGFYDIEVSLNGIINNKARITIKGIYEEIPAEQAKVDTKEIFEKIVTPFKSNKLSFIIAGIIAILVLITASVFFYLRKKRRKFYGY